MDISLVEGGVMKKGARRGYPSDLTEKERLIAMPYLVLSGENAAQ
jgi:hypothetical protein